jgi:hypothetical protein
LREIPANPFSDYTVSARSLPESVEAIGFHSFGECKSLDRITFEHDCSLERIPSHAFSFSALQ